MPCMSPCWLNCRCTDRAGGDERVQMLKPRADPPKGFTGVKAHKLKHIEGCPTVAGILHVYMIPRIASCTE